MFLFDKLKKILILLFSRPPVSVYDATGRYLTVFNNYLERIFYDTLYEFIYKEIKGSERNLYSPGSYTSFLSIFAKSSNENKEVIQEFYRKFSADALVKMSPHVRACFFKVYSGEVIPELILIKTPIKKETKKNKFKMALERIKNIANFKFKSTKEELILEESSMIHDLYEVVVDVILESNPGMMDYMYRFAEAKIRFLKLELNMFKSQNEIPREELEEIARNDRIDINSLLSKDEERVDSLADYHLFIMRMNSIQMEKDILSVDNGMIEKVKNNNNSSKQQM